MDHLRKRFSSTSPFSVPRVSVEESGGFSCFIREAPYLIQVLAFQAIWMPFLAVGNSERVLLAAQPSQISFVSTYQHSRRQVEDSCVYLLILALGIGHSHYRKWRNLLNTQRCSSWNGVCQMALAFTQDFILCMYVIVIRSIMKYISLTMWTTSITPSLALWHLDFFLLLTRVAADCTFGRYVEPSSIRDFQLVKPLVLVTNSLTEIIPVKTIFTHLKETDSLYGLVEPAKEKASTRWQETDSSWRHPESCEDRRIIPDRNRLSGKPWMGVNHHWLTYHFITR